jgi:hypothetical protein
MHRKVTDQHNQYAFNTNPVVIPDKLLLLVVMVALRPSGPQYLYLPMVVHVLVLV